MIKQDLDIFNQIFRSLNMVGSVFFRSTLTAPWRIDLDAENEPRFHIVLEGEALIGLEASDQVIRLRKGDAILISRGKHHWLADTMYAGLNQKDTEQADENHFGGLDCRLLCGALRNDSGNTHPMFSTLPTSILLKSHEQSDLSWILRIAQLMEYEMDQELAGNNAMVERLCEMFFAQAYRHAITQEHTENSFLKALADKQICKALGHIHNEPQKPWNISSLASSVALSRSAFARRFNLLVGMPPNAYMTMWRMNLAMTAIRTGNERIGSIASEVGYASDTSFIRAFQREFGISPSEARISPVT